MDGHEDTDCAPAIRGGEPARGLCVNTSANWAGWHLQVGHSERNKVRVQVRERSLIVTYDLLACLLASVAPLCMAGFSYLDLSRVGFLAGRYQKTICP